MPKRRRSQSPERPAHGRRPPRPSKRARLIPSRLLSLPQELLLRILYQLRPASLLTVSLASKKLNSLASDPQLWKALFWRRFVQPYVMRLGSFPSPAQRPPSEASSLREWRMWLDDAELLQREREVVAEHAEASLSGATMAQEVGSYNADAPAKPKVVGMDWRAKYRLRHNWQRGACRFGEIPLAPQRELAPSYAAIAYHEGFVFIAEREGGLRVWAAGNGRGTEPTLICQHSFDAKLGTPTCLAIDEIICDDYMSGIRRTEGTEVAVGFDTCAFSILNFRLEGNRNDNNNDNTRITPRGYLTPIMQSRASDNTKSTIKFIAYAQSYLCIMTTKPQLFLYHVPIVRRFDGGAEPPRIKLITTLASDSAWKPTAISIRRSSEVGGCRSHGEPRFVASAVFAVHSFLEAGDGMCIQELHVDPSTQKVAASRMAQSACPTFLDQPYVQPLLSVGRTSPPTSTVYRYPFLMTSHADNTVRRYLVTSTEDGLFITPGYKMWGHTAGVAGVAVRRRKAISVDRRGEVRVWDLQGLQKCVRIKGEQSGGGGDGKAIPSGKSGGFIAFGEDEIVLVENFRDREDGSGKTRLLVCNFT